MQQAVESYARYLAGPDAWALARFVLPVSRFAEFETAMKSIGPIEPWGISALLGANAEADLAEIDRFNDRNHARTIVDVVEVKAATSDEICHIRAFVRGSITAYFEIPPDNASELLTTINAIHARAKIRTGGIKPDAIPSSETVARFIMECAKHEVPFKATAGLHHPARCVKPLTYEPDAPTGIMHGFLNVFMAAIAAKRHFERSSEPERVRIQQLSMILDCRHPKFEFNDEIAFITAEGTPVHIPDGAGFVEDSRYPAGMAKVGVPTAQIRA